MFRQPTAIVVTFGLPRRDILLDLVIILQRKRFENDDAGREYS